MKQRIFEIIEGVIDGDKNARYYEAFINILVLLTVITLFLDTYQTLSPLVKTITGIINAVIVVVFTLDYLLRIWTAPLKYPQLDSSQAMKKYAFSRDGIVDALATFPPYATLFLGINLNIFRLFRLLRLFKMKTLADSSSLFGNVFRRKQSELIMVFTLVFILIYVCALLMFYVENPAQPEAFADAGKAMWWAVITLTTIGYGDIYPITSMGRLLGGAVALLGIGVIALPTGILSSGLVEELNARKELKQQAAKQNNAKSGSASKQCPHCGQVLPKT